jgi:hypothetical protein
MISSGLCLFCRFIFVGFGCNKSSHSTWTNFSDGGHLGRMLNHFSATSGVVSSRQCLKMMNAEFPASSVT